MANLTEHVMINKWDDDINEAITFVGGNTYGSGGLPDYANIIRTQLIANNAIGDGVYQDFLYVDKNNNTSPYPWGGDPTDSTNAAQAKIVADSIKALYDQMVLTERFNILLVDEIPTSKIDLSAIYLVKKCGCSDSIYTGCYFVKNGDFVKRVDIPEFIIDFDKLFYVTRGEHVDLSNHVDVLEETLRKKFGKQWENDDFTVDDIMLPLVEEVMAKISENIDVIAEEFEQKFQEKFDGLSAQYIKREELIELNQEILDLV